MRAAVMRGDRFVVEERPMPEPGPGNVLVRVRACGICGSDLHYFHHIDKMIERVRDLGAPTVEMERTVREGPVLGHEFVCEVVDFGAETERRLPVGARVASMPFVIKNGTSVLVGSNPETPGAYAEFMVLTESLLLNVPDEVPDEAAALVEPVGIAVHAVNNAQLNGDETAVVVGCGPIGLAVAAVPTELSSALLSRSLASPIKERFASDAVLGTEASIWLAALAPPTKTRPARKAAAIMPTAIFHAVGEAV